MIKKHAQDKLKFTPLTESEEAMYQGIINYKQIPGLGGFNEKSLKMQKKSCKQAGRTAFITQSF